MYSISYQYGNPSVYIYIASTETLDEANKIADFCFQNNLCRSLRPNIEKISPITFDAFKKKVKNPKSREVLRISNN